MGWGVASLVSVFLLSVYFNNVVEGKPNPDPNMVVMVLNGRGSNPGLLKSEPSYQGNAYQNSILRQINKLNLPAANPLLLAPKPVTPKNELLKGLNILRGLQGCYNLQVCIKKCKKKKKRDCNDDCSNRYEDECKLDRDSGSNEDIEDCANEEDPEKCATHKERHPHSTTPLVGDECFSCH